VCVVISLAFFGCQGRSVLPPDIAGTWKTQNPSSPWEIVLSPDGKVASAVIPMGRVEIRPNQTTKVELRGGGISTYKVGDCTVDYTAETRELSVSVDVQEFRVVIMDNRLDGNIKYYLIGEVSKDGKIWEPDFTEVFGFGTRPAKDPNDLSATPLRFEKVKD
jgi:hypothetical protein